MMTEISNAIRYIGADDFSQDLFESLYVIPEGMAYNSYVILDDKIAVMDTVDIRVTDAWFANLKRELVGREPDYLVSLHVEPDHGANIVKFLEMYPKSKLVCSAKAAQFLPQFFEFDFSSRVEIVKENDELNLGAHVLKFIGAPMVHWPEVLLAYESSEKVLFAADAFGKFGALSKETDDWACEARRYYFNICGKYGAQVQNLLAKVSAFDVQTICPLHGPILKENLSYYIGLYQTWSAYEPETEGVFIAYASIYGNTGRAAEKLAEILKAKGIKVAIADLARTDLAENIEDAFRYSKMVLAASSYDASVMPTMETFLHHLKVKNFQNRKVALIENGTWAPTAAKTMKSILETMKNISILENSLLIRSSLKDESALETFADSIINA